MTRGRKKGVSYKRRTNDEIARDDRLAADKTKQGHAKTTRVYGSKHAAREKRRREHPQQQQQQQQQQFLSPPRPPRPQPPPPANQHRAAEAASAAATQATQAKAAATAAATAQVLQSWSRRSIVAAAAAAPALPSPAGADPGVDHIVLLKVKDGTSPDDIQRLIDGVSSLKSIPGVKSITVGRVFVESWMDDRTGGHNYALRVRLASKDALRTYQDHDLHVKVKTECLAPVLAAPPLALDWESPLVLGEGGSA